MNKKILLTGATGSMGSCGLTELLKAGYNVTAFSLDTLCDREILRTYNNYENLTIYFGDLTCFEDVLIATRDKDYVLHVGAYVSPEADYHPDLAMKINYGSTINIIRALQENGQNDITKLVYIGTVAQTGDRLPPIHYGRVGDPIKPSVFDYYAVSKVAAERAVIESGLKYWVSLRQTGIMSKKMMSISDGIIYHNCLDNILEYVSDRDSGILLKNVCGDIANEFWCHIYNIGGGESCRITSYNMNKRIFSSMGIEDMSSVMDSKWYATRNFHGQSYLDSNKLNNFLNFRSDSIEYMFDIQKNNIGFKRHILKLFCRIPQIRNKIAQSIKKNMSKNLYAPHGTMNFIENNLEDNISAYFISKEKWNEIPHMNELKHFEDWNTVVHIDHGYDESKSREELSIEDIRAAAIFRGGKCLTETMEKGDLTTGLLFECSFGHKFRVSPKAILEGGHWCDVCERESWNYHQIAKSNPFFAQVWYPLHEKNEKSVTYKKVVTELNY